MSNLGVYIGNDPSDFTAFENFMGEPVSFLGAHTGRASWSDWTGSISWLAQQFSSVNAQLTWTIPMFADGGDLADAAAGKYNSYYLEAAQTLAADYSNSSVIYIRTGEEFNGNWMPWSAQSDPQQYIAAYQDFVTVFRSVSSKFKFEWNVNIGDQGMNPALAYPGDKYVDIIGMDFYWNPAWGDPTDPTQAWNYMVTRQYGLQWLENFAAAHGKPTAYAEWGVNSDNAGPYIQDAEQWFASHNVVYQEYWDSNAAYEGALSDYPDAAAAFKAAFTPPPSPPPTVTVTAAMTTIHLAAGSADYVVTATGPVTVDGTSGVNVITASAQGNDRLNGMGGADTLIGGDGTDFLDGGSGAATLIAGAGQTTMNSGPSSTFVFTTINSSTPANPDVILDLQQSDTINLHQIDTSLGLSGADALHRVAAFDGHAGEATYVYDPVHNMTVLSLDVNGDKVPDMVVDIVGNHSTFTNFVW